jgi:cyclophilin family peptidyl-prolyl cis-trans isomerase
MKPLVSSLLFLSVLLISVQCKDDSNTSNNFTAQTMSADSVSSNSAYLTGEVNPDNLTTTVTFEWGETSTYGNTATALQSPITAGSTTKVYCKLDSLLPNTTYHFRVSASNSSGTIYGTDMSFTTLPLLYELPLIHTDFGNILIWLYTQTPLHKANFLSLTKSTFYDSLTFHRVVPNFVIQGGDPLGNGTGGPGYTIPAEFHDSLTHVYGAVGAARNNNPEKRSSGSQFYIVVNKSGTHQLDKNYTVFGIVIDGMQAAYDISSVPNSGSPNNTPLSKVYMTDVEVVTYTAEELKTLYNFKVPTF